MKNKFHALILGVIVFFGLSSTYADEISPSYKNNPAASLKYIIGGLEKDKFTSSLWDCYKRGLQMSISEIASKSDSDEKYFMNLLALGGFTIIGERVRLQCNNVIKISDDSEQSSKKIETTNKFFLALLMQEDSNLFKECEMKEGPSWKATKALCAFNKAKFERQFGAL